MVKKTTYKSKKGDVTFDLQVFPREKCREIISQITKSDFMLYSPILGTGFCPDSVVVSAEHPLAADPFLHIEDFDLNMKVHSALLYVTKSLCERGVSEGEVYSVKLNLPTLAQLDEDTIENYINSKLGEGLS